MSGPYFPAGWAAKAAICQALGIDPAQTIRVVLDSHADYPPRIRITQYMTVEQLGALERVLHLSEWKEDLAMPA